MKPSNKTRLYISIKGLILRLNLGNRLNKIFDPSSGGIGTRLKIARNRLIKIAVIAIFINVFVNPKPTPILMKIDIKIAIKIFESGPAIATNNSPHRWFRKLYGLYGTGFAQPTTKPDPDITKMAGRIIEPNGSKCLIGLIVNRPAYLAVTSPIHKAAYP